MDDLAGNPLGVVACQKSDQTSRIFRNADPAHPQARQQGFLHLFIQPESVGPGSTALTVMRSGANSAASDSVNAEMAPLVAA